MAEKEITKVSGKLFGKPVYIEAERDACIELIKTIQGYFSMDLYDHDRNTLQLTPEEKAQLTASPNKEELSCAYRATRAKFALSLREAAALLEVSPKDISKLESAGIPKPKLERDTSRTIKAICHWCQTEFETNPLLADGQLILFPHWVCDNCKETNEKGYL